MWLQFLIFNCGLPRYVLKQMNLKLFTLIFIFTLVPLSASVNSLKIKLKSVEGIKRIEVLNELAFNLWEENSTEAYRYAVEARDLSSKLSYKKGLAWAYNNIGLSHLNRNKNKEAYSALQKGLKIFIELKDTKGIATCYDNIGDTHRFRGSIDSALYYYNLSLPLFKKIGDRKGEAMAYSSLGLMYWRKGLNNEALNNFYISYVIRKELGLKLEIAMSLNNIGTIYWRYANYEKALESYSESLRLREEINDEKGQIVSGSNIGLIFHKMKNYDKAETLYRTALSRSEKINFTFGKAYANHNLGLLFLDKKDYDRSIVFSQKAVKYYYEINELNAVAHSLSYIGSAYAGKGDDAKAVKYFNAAIDTALKADDKYSLAITYQSIAKLNIHRGDINEAEKHLQKAYEISLKENLSELITEHYLNYSNLLQKKGDVTGAFNYYKKYIEAKDNLRLEQMNNDITNWQIKYEVDKKESENQKLREENVIKQAQFENQRNLNNLLFVILIVAVLTFSISILYIRLKRKTQQKIIEQKNELELLNKKLALKNENLKEANHSKDKLFSIISHDLRSPFQSIIGLSDILHSERDKLTKEEISEFAGSINRSSRNLLTLTNNILEWSKMQLNKISIDKKEINLSEIFEQVILAYYPQASEKKISLEVISGNEVKLISDAHLLSTVLRNLVNNSIKFSKPGGSVKLGAVLKAEFVDIFVEDNGIGLNEDDLPKIFDIKQNFSTAGTNNERGTGLGLIICKEFVETLNGKIIVNSRLGIGTRFTVSIPVE